MYNTFKTSKILKVRPQKYAGATVDTEDGSRAHVSTEAGHVGTGEYAVIRVEVAYRSIKETVVASSSDLEEATTVSSNWEKSFQLEEELERRIREAANELVEDVPQHVLESAEEAALAALPPVFHDKHVGKQARDEGRGYDHFYEKVDVNRGPRGDSIRSRIREWLESEAAIRVGAEEVKQEILHLRGASPAPAPVADPNPSPAVPAPEFGTSFAEALGGLGKC